MTPPEAKPNQRPSDFQRAVSAVREPMACMRGVHLDVASARRLVSKPSRQQRREGPGRPTHFQAFPNGTLIETVRDPAGPETFRLLICRGQTAIIADQFEYGGKLYLPGMINPGLAKNLRLPSGSGPCRQPRDLLAEMFAALHPYVDVPDEDLRIICFFVLTSWFPDCLPIAPYLWLVGPLGSGKSTLLKLLQA